MITMLSFHRFHTAILGVCIACTTCNRTPTSEQDIQEIQVPVFTRIDTGTLVNEVVRGRGLYPVDIDLDHDLDLFIGNSTGAYFESVGSGRNRPNLLYRNEGDCRFTKVTTGILASTIYEHNPGNNWGDFDNDGDLDVLEANFCFFGSCDSLLPCRLYINQGDGTFSSLDNGTSLVTDALGAGGAAWGGF